MKILEQLDSDKSPAGPTLAAIPKSADKRLIDVGMLQYESSAAGFTERYRRGETPQTLQVWWARRPHRAMRALVYACLCRGTKQDSLELLNAITADANPDPKHLQKARQHLKDGWSHAARVLDMFAGGGTIPFEAAVLGADSHALDSNQLSVALQRATLVLSHSLAPVNIAAIIEESGRRVLGQLRDCTAKLFPLRGQSFGYLWTYSLPCVDCGFRMLLSKRQWLSRKKGRNLAFVVENSTKQQRCKIDTIDPDHSFTNAWRGRNGTVACPKCNSIQKVHLSRTEDELIGVIGLNKTSGKSFQLPPSGSLPTEDELLSTRQSILYELQIALPTSKPPQWSGIVNPSVYGMDTHADVFNLRQQCVILSLIKCMREEHRTLMQAESREMADAVIGLLSGLLDQLIDWNCRLSMWIPQNEQVGRGFCGPGIAMLWDYCETDPCESGPANLRSKLDRIVAGVQALPQMESRVSVARGYAQSLPFPDRHFDAIITDPPYYDNIFYNVLADFFYAWKKPLLKDIFPDLFSDDRTDPTRELVASTIRSGSPEKAHTDYCRELSLAVHEAQRCLKDDGIFALVFSHSTLQGWESVIRAYRATQLAITSVQPLSIERRQRPRAMTSDAINTCVVFVARRGAKRKPVVSVDELSSRLRLVASGLGESLKQSGWSDEDTGVAVFSQAIGMMANAKRVSGCENDIDALTRCADICADLFPGFRVVSRKPL